jgi:malonyl-CoA O-methyltransferase
MNPAVEQAKIDKTRARRSFERSAARYDQVAVLQREIADRMMERLELIKIQPRTILDVGAGTGYATEALLKRYPKAHVFALDFAYPMLQQARRRGRWLRRPRCVCADAERLPLTDGSVDLLFSNATLQWCNDLDATFREFLRVLRPNGLLMFSTFGPDTLQELRGAWSRVDGYGHVSRFADMHDLGDGLMQARFAEPVMDMEYLTLTYSEVGDLMRDLKTLGAHNASSDRPRGLTGKARMAAVKQAYEAFRRDGRLPASYEVVYGHAWVPEQKPLAGEEGGVAVPLSALGG